MNNAIRKAVEGGYQLPEEIKKGYKFIKTWRGSFLYEIVDGKETDIEFSVDTILLDPQFWQCLGKALWWKEDERRYGTARWHYEAVRFMQDIMMGKSVDTFFKSLLSDK
jgi:hypothetical protein